MSTLYISIYGANLYHQQQLVQLKKETYWTLRFFFAQYLGQQRERKRAIFPAAAAQFGNCSRHAVNCQHFDNNNNNNNNGQQQKEREKKSREKCNSSKKKKEWCA